MKWVIPYKGRNWFYEDEQRLTLTETRLMKRATGLTPGAARQARLEDDGEGWVAALVLARFRAGEPEQKALVVDPNELDIKACRDATNDALDDEDDPADEPEPATTS